MSEVTWKGAYCYKEEFDDSDCHGFDLRVIVDEDEFYGTAPEQEFTSLTGDAATVEGFIEGDHISFTKKYPYLYILEDDGTFIFDQSKPGHEVIYTGQFNAELHRWEGEWEVHGMETKFPNGDWEVETIWGTWIMKTDKNG